MSNLFNETMEESSEKDKKITDLETKLAEKEEEIKNVTIKHLDMLRYFIRHNSKQGIILSSDLEREIKEIEQGEKIWQTKNFNQYKISFCIEQLEKVKEFCDGIVLSMKYVSNQDATPIQAIIDEIDQKIRALKKEN